MPNNSFGESSCTAAASGMVEVRGAREHNLKDVDVAIPRNALVVFSGVSGSGKSSLAFGTIYAEAQRRYFESVAPYARRLIDQAGVPDVDAIDGLPPAVALQQQRGSSNARSSVGSVTTLSSLVRMMYSRAGAYPANQPMLYAEDFSPNTPQGACPTCHGRRYNAQTLEVTLRGKSIADVLDMTVAEASTFFADDAAVARPCTRTSGAARSFSSAPSACSVDHTSASTSTARSAKRMMSPCPSPAFTSCTRNTGCPRALKRAARRAPVALSLSVTRP